MGEGEELPNNKREGITPLNKATKEMLDEVRRYAESGEVGYGVLAPGEKDPEDNLTEKDFLRLIARNTESINKNFRELNMLFRRYLKYYRRAESLIPDPDKPIQGSTKRAPANPSTAEEFRRKILELVKNDNGS